MANINKAIILGRLTRDAELRYTNNTNTAVANFCIATTEKRKDSQPITTFHDAVLWGKTAERLADWLRKGRTVYIEGPITRREYTKKDGTPGTKIEIRAEHVEFLDAPEPSPQTIQDDLPF